MVNDMICAQFQIPVVWGGVFATLEPKIAAQHCDCVIRGEGEKAIVSLADAIQSGARFDSVQNAAFYRPDGTYVQNEVAPLEQYLDHYGYPSIGAPNLFLIHNDRLAAGDPQLNSYTYELGASRGCPFSCSYCSSINLRRVYTGKGRYVRFWSVNSVMEELCEAKAKMPHLRVIHFWDEIFSDNREWVEEFSRRYRKKIGLPFRIWGHPLLVREQNIAMLVSAGLYQIPEGIQSGSARVRTQVFHRKESQSRS